MNRPSLYAEYRGVNLHQLCSGLNRYNGAGFPEDIDFRNTSSLGLQLVNELVKQLDGTIELNKDKGTEFKIIFKELEYKKRI